ncbi:MAG TPA: acyl carrier protein [Bacteroidales bacterium]|nr:acyl carrier protein [Bacteroidales bacterium]
MEINIEDFILHLEEEFEEDILQGSLKPDTQLEKAIALTSVNALILISMVKVEYDIELTAQDLNKCKTINDLFETIKNKKK